jgi:signal transduction histidine kinase
LYFTRPIEWIWRSSFRYTAALFAAIAATIVLSFSFAYVQTSKELVSQLDSLVLQEAQTILARADAGDLTGYEERLRQDPRRVKPTGMFAADGTRISGNVDKLPPELQTDQPPIQVGIVRIDRDPPVAERARSVARRLPDGRLLFVGWSTADNEQTADLVERGLILGLVPAVILGLAASLVFGAKAHQRVNEMQIRIGRIVAGDLKQRLPAGKTSDPLDHLANIVNSMLDEIQALVENLAAIGDDIAHDLRTPLARVRIGLERARRSAHSIEDLQAANERAIAGIDHAIAIVTALLRIREIEQTRRLEAFDEVDLATLVDEVGELYEPFAEEKQLTLAAETTADILVRGDRDLLFEALANLVDNAVKYTPPGGRIEVRLGSEGGRNMLRISDTGPGVVEAERALILQRFYRSDRSRHTKGLGLGLTLVAAIIKLHGFEFEVRSKGGFTVDIVFPPAL